MPLMSLEIDMNSKLRGILFMAGALLDTIEIYIDEDLYAPEIDDLRDVEDLMFDVVNSLSDILEKYE